MDAVATHWMILTFGILGNMVSSMVFLAPLPTFYSIYKKKSTQGFQSIPYVVALFSAMLWLYYASLKPNTLLVTINTFGLFIETIYIGFFLFYADKKIKMETIKVLGLLVVAGFGLIVGLTHFLVKEVVTRGVIVGWMCLILSLCVFVAPLGILRQVLRTKSVEYMPFLLSFFLTISAVMWFFYGLLLKDYNIWIPNVLGFSFGILQMVLYVIYKDNKKVIEEKKKVSDQLPDQIIILDQERLPEQIIDMVKLGTLMQSEKISVNSPHHGDNNGHEISKIQSVNVPPPQTPLVQVAA
ncbi:hypothetical protein Leryth_003823 [Lithospermum erythrorhizon]|nr:hypothetical protein Leryth_003823 [Lithospermum erythrorhizon]